jgi:hypothetical protein
MPPVSEEGGVGLGVSEVIGTLILIGVVVAGMTLVAILLLSQPLPTKVPVLDAIISNQSRNIYIYHKGGDPLFRGQYQILVDGGDQTGNFTNSGDEPWSVGETLSNTTPTMPHRVVIVFNESGSGGGVLAAQDLSGARTAPQVQSNGWYNLSVSGQCDWSYRKSVTIDHTQVASPGQSSFPVLISIASDPDLTAHARPDGNDLLFTSTDGVTKLSYEIESYSSGSLVVWVNVPTLSSTTDTLLYLYYGNTTGTDSQQNPTEVWVSNYKGVWHMNEVGNGAPDDYKDSTQFGNNGQGGLGISSYVPAQVPGKINQAQQYDGKNSNIQVLPADSINDFFQGGGTFSAWIYPSSAGEKGEGRIGDKCNGALGQKGWSLGTYTASMDSLTNALMFHKGFTTTNGNWTTPDGSITLNAWNYVVVTYDSSSKTNDPFIYINGVNQAVTERRSPNGNFQSDAIYNLSVGNRPGRGYSFDGTIDEIRALNSILSADWITTEYNNERRPSTFSSVGNEEYYWRC